MPSFLSKVFGGKKEENGLTTPTTEKEKDKKRLSTPNSLLEGVKFEAVTPPSPLAENLPLNAPVEKEKERDGFSLGLLRTLSAGGAKSSSSSKDGSAQSQAQQPPSTALSIPPHLSLNLPTASRNLGTLEEVFAAAQVPEKDIRERRLSVEECLALVKVCAGVIAMRGLETPGIMHPHWHSSSPNTQRRLISSFLSATPSDEWHPDFKAEQNMYDVASVLRWALRHLQLPASSSGSSSFGTKEDWYTSFIKAERDKSYPPTVFSSDLPALISSKDNLELLKVTLDLFSGLASHAEKNATSASKLSKALGLFLLDHSSTTAGKSWEEFYTRWETNGRILEHLFLASIRDEEATTSHRMPRRLLELVKGYPYSSNPSTDLLLSPSRFSTRKHPALLVQILTELPPSPETDLIMHAKSGGSKKKKEKLKVDTSLSSNKPQPKKTEEPEFNPLQTLTDALLSKKVDAEDELDELWVKIRDAYTTTTTSSSEETTTPSLGLVFSDETIRLLSLASPLATSSIVPTHASTGKEDKPAFSFSTSGPSEEAGHRRSFSLDRAASSGSAAAGAKSLINGHGLQASSSTSSTAAPSPLTASSSVGLDWNQFSTSGFFAEDGKEGGVGAGGGLGSVGKLASTLMDTDVETSMPAVGRKASKASKKDKERGRGSLDVLPSIAGVLPSTNAAANANAKDGEGKGAAGEGEKKEKAEGERKSVILNTKRIALDESFPDFFSDSILDWGVYRMRGVPISSSTTSLSSSPSASRFVVGRVRSDLANSTTGEGEGGKEKEKRIEWLVVEQSFGTIPKPQPKVVSAVPEPTPALPTTTAAAKTEVAESPKKEKEKKVEKKEKEKEPSSPISIPESVRKRFTFFSSLSSKPKQDKEKGDKTEKDDKKEKEKGKKEVKVGEMGEILKEEDEPKEEKTKEGEIVTAAAAGTTAAVLGAAAVVAGAKDEKEEATPETESKPSNGVPVSSRSETEPVLITAPASEVPAKEGGEGEELKTVPASQIKVAEAVVVDGVPISPPPEKVKDEVPAAEAPATEPVLITAPADAAKAEEVSKTVPASEVKVPEPAVVDDVPISPPAEEGPEPVAEVPLAQTPPTSILVEQFAAQAEPEVAPVEEEIPPPAEPAIEEIKAFDFGNGNPGPVEPEPEPEVVTVEETPPSKPVVLGEEEEKGLEEPEPEPEAEPEVAEPEPEIEASPPAEEVAVLAQTVEEVEPEEVIEHEPEPVVEEEEAPVEPTVAPHVEEVAVPEPEVAEPEPEAFVQVVEAEPEAEVLEEFSAPVVEEEAPVEPEEPAAVEPEPVVEAPPAVVEEVAEPEDEPEVEVSPQVEVEEAAPAEPAVIETTPEHIIEPIREPSPGKYEEETVIQDPFPTVNAEPVLASENAVAIPPVAEAEAASAEAPAEEEPAAVEPESAPIESELPPAPESVVLSGSTPGPEVALSTSESAAEAAAETAPAPESLPKGDD